MVGLIGSSIGAGLIISRTGRYKWLIVGAIALMGVSTALMTQLTADTPVPVVWFWMFIAGLGVGPTFSVFTLVVQNAVPFHYLGVATSNLTFFRQIGGTVALAIVGTIFGTAFGQELVPSMAAAGVPQQLVDGFQAGVQSGAVDLGQLTGTGDLGQTILANAGPLAPMIEPFISNIVAGIHIAFSLAIAQTFWIGVGASIIAAIAAMGMKELALSHATPGDRGRRGAGTRSHGLPSGHPGRRLTLVPSSHRRPRLGLRAGAGVVPALGSPGDLGLRTHCDARPVPPPPDRTRHRRRAVGRAPRGRCSAAVARCAASHAASSTCCSRTPRRGSSPSPIVARTWPRRCRSARSMDASSPARSTRACSTCAAATRSGCRRPAGSTPTASTTRRGRPPACHPRPTRLA